MKVYLNKMYVRLVLALVLVACGGGQQTATPSAEKAQETLQITTEWMLVTYSGDQFFSRNEPLCEIDPPSHCEIYEAIGKINESQYFLAVKSATVDDAQKILPITFTWTSSYEPAGGRTPNTFYLGGNGFEVDQLQLFIKWSYLP